MGFKRFKSWYRSQSKGMKKVVVAGVITGSFALLAAMVTGAVAIVVTVISNHGPTPQLNPSHSSAVSTASYVKIQSPPLATSGTSPVSKVACTEEVRGVAEIPSGDVVVVANKPENSPSWHFIDAGPPLGKNWSVVVHFSAPGHPDAGRVFDVAAFALKTTDIPGYAISGNWDRSTLPSSRTGRPDSGVVQRSSNAKYRCNWWK